MLTANAYRFNRDTFAFECFDEEVVVLDLVEGVYYAFGGAAVVAWPYIIAQHPEPVIASTLAKSYGVRLDELTRDLTEFVERLVSEKSCWQRPRTFLNSTALDLTLWVTMKDSSLNAMLRWKIF